MYTGIDNADIERWFSHHEPNEEQIERIKQLRAGVIEYGKIILACTRRCPDQAAAFRHLRECSMTAIAAIVLEINKEYNPRTNA